MIDILAIGAHPDDVELSCGGTILKQISLGNKVAILDLTDGDLGTRGNGDIRRAEAEDSANILGLTERYRLHFRDGFFSEDEDHIREVVRILRLTRPKIVLCNAVDDRHPDHSKGASLVKKACFYSGLIKFVTEHEGQEQEVWRPESIYHYIQFKYLRPDFIVDVTPFYEKKMEAIKAYKSQFYDPESDEPETLISSKEFLEFLDARSIEFGRIIGAKYAEGFNISRIPEVDDLNNLK